MKFNTRYDVQQGDTVLVDFSKYSDGNKKRPAVVISSNTMLNKNTVDGYFIVAPIYTVHDVSKVGNYTMHIPVRQDHLVDKSGASRGTSDTYSYLALEQKVSVSASEIICKLGELKSYKIGYSAQVRATIAKMY